MTEPIVCVEQVDNCEIRLVVPSAGDRESASAGPGNCRRRAASVESSKAYGVARVKLGNRCHWIVTVRFAPGNVVPTDVISILQNDPAGTDTDVVAMELVSPSGIVNVDTGIAVPPGVLEYDRETTNGDPTGTPDAGTSARSVVGVVASTT